MKTKKTIYIASFFLLLAFSLGSFGQSIHSQVYDAQTAIAKQEWTQAEAILTTANQTSPNNPYVLFEMAQVYENTQRLERAAKVYDTLAQIPNTKLREYVVLVRSADGVQPTNLADLTTASMERLKAKQAAAPKPETVAPVASAVLPAALPVALPAVAPSPVDATSVTTAATNALQIWATAWANKDLTAYFASYVEHFQGDQATTAAWMKSRRARIEGEKTIMLDLSDIQITALSATKAAVNFKQTYSSGSVKEMTQKSLLMSKSGNKWLIERESTQ